MAESPGWVPLESNPDVLTKYSRSLGATVGEWVDVYGFDDESLKCIPNVKALLLLFPISRKYEEFTAEQDKTVEGCQIVSPELFYMKQTIHNACGTIGVIHSLANNVDCMQLEDGKLSKFLDATKGLNPEERGKVLENSGDIAHAHEECSSEGQTDVPSVDEKLVTHFVAFVEKNHHVYELDGRRKYPINHGWTTDETWLKDAAKVCESRIKELQSDKESEYRFSVLALSVPGSE